ncbi:MAG TPA: prepilin-type N-terminal cleavage/methylation domain-containing protein [Terrimicrobiaceae bacterium]|nr:prepilin-type N-terminal cleavage/methylation domain-containing protein [Terrimicrobiaceae bacterium]
MKPSRPHLAAAARAFSLIELLLVVVIFAVLAGMALTGFNSVSTSTKIQRAGDAVADALILSRQQALTRNAIVDMRIFSDTTGRYRSFQLFERQGTNLSAVSRKTTLPEGIQFLDSLSPLLASAPTASLPAPCRLITLQPNGEPLLPAAISSDLSSGYLTIGMERDAAGSGFPQNYATVFINPYTGLVNIYRP